MSILYDYPSILSEHDAIVEEIYTFNNRVSHAAAPGNFLVELFPWMMHIPERSYTGFPANHLLILTREWILDLQNGRRKACGTALSTKNCSSVFWIVFEATWYVLLSRALYKVQLTDR